MAPRLPAESPTAAAPTDAAGLSRGAWNGSTAAFEALYRAWFPRTLRIARALSRRDEAFCLDVTQEVMLRAAKGLPRVHNEAELAAWFSRATLSATIDQLRRERRRVRREQWKVTEASTPSAPTPFEDLASLRASFFRLPAADQTLLMQRLAHGLTIQQAGASIGLSTQAAHGRIRRALTRLRTMLHEVLP